MVPVSARCEALYVYPFCYLRLSPTRFRLPLFGSSVASRFPLFPNINRKVGADPEVQQSSKLKFQISGNINVREKQNYRVVTLLLSTLLPLCNLILRRPDRPGPKPSKQTSGVDCRAGMRAKRLVGHQIHASPSQPPKHTNKGGCCERP